MGTSRPGAVEWHGTLDRLRDDVVMDEGDLPGIIVVGAVAALAGMLSAGDAGRDDAAAPRSSVSSR